MQALIFERRGDPLDALRLEEIASTTPAAGEILVRVLMAPIHTADIHTLRGKFGRQPRFPASPGFECVSTVVASGPATVGPPLGTRVVLIDIPGTWREFIAARWIGL